MAQYTDNLNLIKPAQGENYNVDVANTNNEIIDNAIGNKQDKIPGKGMSSNDFTNEYKRKLDAVKKIYTFKGSVSTYNDLSSITEKEVGDVWNILDTGDNYSWNGEEWTEVGIDTDFADLENSQVIQSSIITTTEEIAENTNYTIPLNYKVGNNSLEISYMGEKLIKDIHYIEVGNTGEVSNTIQFYNWGQAVPSGRTIEFIVRGVYE
ncbi:MAG: hypothetical protein IJK18_08390 [Clostridia bacterium]|nr:hypothetical protein [Clostridia bacterium]